MKIQVIRQLVKDHNLDELRSAEEAIINEEQPSFDIGGEDEGEQLTHVIAAVEILENIEKGMTEKEALRSFTQRVRNSIS